MVGQRFRICFAGALAGVVVLVLGMSARSISHFSARAQTPAADSPEKAGGWGTLKGQIIYKGKIPLLPPLVRKGQKKVTDGNVCAAHDVADESLVIDAKSRGVANVFVYLRKKPERIHPDLVQIPKKKTVFDQKQCRFLPHALALRTGQPLLLKSSDPILHNTNIVGHINVLLQPQGDPIPFQFKKCSLVPIPVECNFHPWMKAWLLPLDHPYFAVTGKQGQFTIEKLPAGKLEFRLWQERAGYVNNGKVKNSILEVAIQPGQTTEVRIELDAESLGIGKKRDKQGA